MIRTACAMLLLCVALLSSCASSSAKPETEAIAPPANPAVYVDPAPLAPVRATEVRDLSAYAFSTENWRRSPDEVRFLMGFNRDVIRRRRDQLNSWGVRMRWVGRRPRLWRSVINELEIAQEMTRHNTGLTLYFCVNYGGRAEIADAVVSIAQEVAAGKLKPSGIDERTIARHLGEPSMPDVDLFVRSSGEQRTSNFLLWQSAYAEMVFLDTLWPDFDRRHLWQAVQMYAARDRRYGGAIDVPEPSAHPVPAVHQEPLGL